MNLDINYNSILIEQSSSYNVDHKHAAIIYPYSLKYSDFGRWPI